MEPTTPSPGHQQLTPDGQQLLGVLDTQSQGALPLFQCEEIDTFLGALLQANGGCSPNTNDGMEPTPPPPPSGHQPLTPNGQRLLRVLDKQSKGELPLFLCEEIDHSIDALLLLANGGLFPDTDHEVLVLVPPGAAAAAAVAAAVGGCCSSSLSSSSITTIPTRNTTVEKIYLSSSLSSSSITTVPTCNTTVEKTYPSSSLSSSSITTVLTCNTTVEKTYPSLSSLREQQPLCRLSILEINSIAEPFLSSVATAVHTLLCAEFCPERAARGLYKDWFDDDKVTAAIRLCPQVLSKKWKRVATPIAWQTWKLQQDSIDYDAESIFYALNSLWLIPLLARLGEELGVRFRDDGDDETTNNGCGARGGLLSRDLDGVNVLQNLCIYPWVLFRNEEQQQKLCDVTIRKILETLRDEKLLVRDDIREHNLVESLLCWSSVEGVGGLGARRVFPEHRFRFLSDWDPTTLATPVGLGQWFGGSSNSNSSSNSSRNLHPHPRRLPIHWSIRWGGASASATSSDDDDDLRAFSIVLAAGMKHYPEKIGFVFTNEHDDDDGRHHKRGAKRTKTQCVPYFEACERYGAKRVKAEVLGRLVLATTTTTTTTHPACCSKQQQLTPEGFLLAAVSDGTMDGSGVHLILRNFPGALTQLLRRKTQTSTVHTHTRTTTTPTTTRELPLPLGFRFVRL